MFDKIKQWLLPKVRVTTHTAYMNGVHCAFVTVVNISDRDVEITHVYFADEYIQIPILQDNRPLPKRLRPVESWETWIPTTYVAPYIDLSQDGRVRLSTGEVYKAKWDYKVPKHGQIPGGQNG